MSHFSFSVHDSSYCCFTENSLNFQLDYIGLEYFGEAT